jgi:hypothetical protein
MAQDIVGGLFGITPEMYQQNVGENILQQGVQMGQLAPDAFGRANVYAGAAQLGRGIGGALGAVDPQLKLISARNAVMQEVDPTNPDSLMAGAQRLSQFDPVGANALANAAREAQVKLSQVVRNTREARGLSVGQDVLKAETEASYLAAIRQLQGMEQTPENAAALQIYKDKLAALTRTKEAAPLDIQKAQDYRKALIKEGAPPAQIAEVDRYIKGLEGGRGTTVTMPEIKLPTDINALARGYEEAIKDDVNVKNLSFNAKGLINQAATSNNPSAWEAARTQVAKAVGEGKLSNEDIARTGVDPTLIGGVRDWIDKKVTGVPDQKTQQALYVVASYLEKNASQRIAEKRNNRVAMAKQVNPSVDAAAMFPDYSGAAPAAGAAPATAAGTGKVVDYKDLGRK